MPENKRTFVYLIAETKDGDLTSPVKIGVSDNPKGRLQTLQCGSSRELVLLHVFSLPCREAALYLEKMMLGIEDGTRVRGEWLDLDPIEAVQLTALSIGCILVSAGASGELLTEIMTTVGASPVNENSMLIPNYGNL